MFTPDVLLTFVINIGNSDTSLLLLIKSHVHKPVNSDGMF